MRAFSLCGSTLLATAALALSGCGGNTDSIGSGSSASSSRQEQAPVLADADRLSAGLSFTAALAADGAVYTWGDNAYGQLGNGENRGSLVPVLVSLPGSSAVKITAGGYHTMILARDGTVWAWGNNSYGQLGTGKLDMGSTTPAQIANLNGVRSIAAGYLNSYAIRQDGSLWGWGRAAGKVTALPTQLPNIQKVRSVSAGQDYGLAVTEDGYVWAWGDNSYGQLGLPVGSAPTPLPLIGIDKVYQVSAGYTHSMALKFDGSVWAWGANPYGQLGANPGVAPNIVEGLPVVRSASEVKAIAAGIYNSAVLYEDGSVWAWGMNFAGQLGNDSLNPGLVPAKVPGLGKVVAIAVSGGFIVAMTDAGQAYGIGYNASGQLGNNSFFNAAIPVQVAGRSGVGYLDLGKSTGR